MTGVGQKKHSKQGLKRSKEGRGEQAQDEALEIL